MKASSAVLPMLVFEAAGCLMAVPADEIAHLEKRGREGFSHPLFDLGRYFIDTDSDGPWLHWTRGTRSAWLRVRRVIDVVPVALAGLTPMPALLGAHLRSRAFLAAGVSGTDVFLVLDPGRLTS